RGMPCEVANGLLPGRGVPPRGREPPERGIPWEDANGLLPGRGPPGLGPAGFGAAGFGAPGFGAGFASGASSAWAAGVSGFGFACSAERLREFLNALPCLISLVQVCPVQLLTAYFSFFARDSSGFHRLLPRFLDHCLILSLHVVTVFIQSFSAIRRARLMSLV